MLSSWIRSLTSTPTLLSRGGAGLCISTICSRPAIASRRDSGVGRRRHCSHICARSWVFRRTNEGIKIVVRQKLRNSVVAFPVWGTRFNSQRVCASDSAAAFSSGSGELRVSGAWRASNNQSTFDVFPITTLQLLYTHLTIFRRTSYSFTPILRPYNTPQLITRSCQDVYCSL